MQFGFMKGTGTTAAMIWIVKQIQEKMLERNNNVYCAFVDLEKAFDRVPREVTFWYQGRMGTTRTNCEIG